MKEYTKETLIQILISYNKMIERNKDTPTVLIDDLQKSINYVLRKNGMI